MTGHDSTTLSEASERILEALRIVTADGWTASVREIAEQADRSKSTTHRHLEILVDHGFALRHPRGQDGWMPA